VTNDDLLFRHRVRLFARAQEVGVRRACRELGVHHSTYYRWKPLVERHGLEILRPRERRPPRMPNQLPPFLEERIVAFALGHPGLGPRRIAAELRRDRWGGMAISHNGVYRTLCRHGLATRRRRLALVAGYRSPPEPERREIPEELHLEAETPGALVQLDCFHIGRLQGTKGRVWQYTATDVHSGFLWGELHVTPLNPAARHTSALVRRVARDLAEAGWKMRAVSTDNGSEFRAGEFRTAVAALGAEHRFIRAGRPQTNGCVERAQRTTLEECWRPTFARSLVPKYTALRRDLARYLAYFNFDRAHLGRHTKGRTPAEVVYGSRKMRPR
jgi:transposase InsO family protein